MRKKVYVAAVIAVVGAVLSFLLCTMFLAENIILMLSPLWLSAVFTVLYLVLDTVPQTAGKRYIKLGVMSAAALVLAVVLIFIGSR